VGTATYKHCYLAIFLPGVVFGEKLGVAKYFSAKLIFRFATMIKMAKKAIRPK
jgi:hypothetical protein